MSLALQWGFKQLDLDKRIKKLIVPDMSSIVPDLERLWNAEMLKIFRAEGAVDNRPHWHALARFTAAERRKQGFQPDHPILVRTGRLRAAVTSSKLAVIVKKQGLLRFTVRPSKASYGRAGGRRLTVARVAAIHHYGRAGRPIIPPRPFYFMTNRFKKQAGKLVSKLIREQKKQVKNA